MDLNQEHKHKGRHRHKRKLTHKPFDALQSFKGKTTINCNRVVEEFTMELLKITIVRDIFVEM